MGATVVDRASVVTTHLAEIAREHAPQLLSRQDVKALVGEGATVEITDVSPAAPPSRCSRCCCTTPSPR
jgi:flagellar biosynthesis component FlhA